MKKERINKKYITQNAKSISEENVDATIAKNKQILNKLKLDKWQPFKAEVILLISMLKAYKDRTYTDTPWKSITAITFTLIYIINPFDIVPDFIPFVGYLDDISVLSFCLKLIRNDIESYKNWQHLEDKSIS